ncbi:MAG: hypothetical protein M3Y60_04210 [Bacteroidota bacterium]|nr:hypothetical protein [Bacteroidota bacterium]
MTQADLRNYYGKRHADYSATLNSVRAKINNVSNVRLILAAAFLVLLYLGLTSHGLFYSLPFVLVVFVFYVREHARLFAEKIRLENLQKIQNQEMHSIDGDFSHNSSGSEFIDVHHAYTHDLDIFGEGSVFQYMNRGHTRGAKALLARRLSQKPGSIAEVRQWQEAVSELATKTDFRQEVQALSMQVNEQPHDQRQLAQWISEPDFIHGKSPYRLVLNVFPVVTVLLVVLAFFVDGLTPFAIFAAALQWIFLGFHLRRVKTFHEHISQKKDALEKYAAILYFIRKENFTSSLMRSLASRAAQADEKVRRLAKLVRAFDARLNSMTNLVVNSLLMYDLQCVYRLEKWKSENASDLMGWLEVIRETEVLCSLGTFSFNHPRFSFPSINSDLLLTARGLGHPLLREEERVVNDLHADSKQSLLIITGANMAGKSTFLRSLGVNAVLGLAGAPVCAEQFDCPMIDIRSGMRTADSLKENQSYFYAELDRLKSIMDELREGKPLLILLDEILKGTNSTDKQAGSIALVKQLVGHSCLAIIATHDLALGELEESYPGRVLNYSFEADITNGHLFFDYKLKRGIARNMNATFLMKKMGIIPAS